MHARIRSTIAIAAGLTLAATAGPEWTAVEGNGRAAVELKTATVLDTPARTTLRNGTSALDIAWLGNAEARDFRRETHTGGLTRSVQRSGSTTITRTVLASEKHGAIFIHFLADMPGALTFRVAHGGPRGVEAHIEDRRQLILPPGKSSTGAHIRVLPFESDVTPGAHSITVRGEGEALVIWTYAPDQTPAETWEKLGDLHDPGHRPPDPAKIWRGVLEDALRAAENSP